MSLKIKKISNNTEGRPSISDYFKRPSGDGFVEIGYDKYVFLEYSQSGYEVLNAFQVRDDDVFVIGHPKTGTTWLQEIVYLMIHNLDFVLGKTFVEKSRKSLELFMKINSESLALNELNEMGSPRCIRTHLSWPLLPEQLRNSEKKHKIIYIYRNPMDVCCSYYNYISMLHGDIGDFDNFCRLFLEGNALYGPFHKSVLSYWNERYRQNLLIINYKDMKTDLLSVIKTIANFLDRDFTDVQLEQFPKHLSFEETKQRNEKEVQQSLQSLVKPYNSPHPTRSFYRKGEEGTYKLEMSPQLIEKFETWIEEKFGNTGLSF